MKNAFFGVALLATVSGIAQVPAAVKEAFAKNFRGITVKKWDKEGGHYEANFTKDGERMSAIFNVNGVLEETETDIKLAQLPSSITGYIKTKCNGAAIKEAAILTNARGEKMYEAEVKGRDLLFDMQGQFLKEEED